MKTFLLTVFLGLLFIASFFLAIFLSTPHQAPTRSIDYHGMKIPYGFTYNEELGKYFFAGEIAEVNFSKDSTVFEIKINTDPDTWLFPLKRRLIINSQILFGKVIETDHPFSGWSVLTNQQWKKVLHPGLPVLFQSGFSLATYEKLETLPDTFTVSSGSLALIVNLYRDAKYIKK